MYKYLLSFFIFFNSFVFAGTYLNYYLQVPGFTENSESYIVNHSNGLCMPLVLSYVSDSPVYNLGGTFEYNSPSLYVKIFDFLNYNNFYFSVQYSSDINGNSIYCPEDLSDFSSFNFITDSENFTIYYVPDSEDPTLYNCPDLLSLYPGYDIVLDNKTEKECMNLPGNFYNYLLDNDSNTGYDLISSSFYVKSENPDYCPDSCLIKLDTSCVSFGAAKYAYKLKCEQLGNTFSDFSANLIGGLCVDYNTINFSCVSNCKSCDTIKSEIACDQDKILSDFKCEEDSNGCGYNVVYSCSFDNNYDIPSPFDENGDINLDYIKDSNLTLDISVNKELLESFEPNNSNYSVNNYVPDSPNFVESSDQLTAINNNGRSLSSINSNIANINKAISDLSVSQQILNKKEEGLIDKVLDFSMSDSISDTTSVVNNVISDNRFEGFVEGIFNFPGSSDIQSFSYTINIYGEEYVLFSSNILHKYLDSYINYIRTFFIVIAFVAALFTIFSGGV